MLKRILLIIDAIFICLLSIVGIDYSSYIANVKYVSDTKTVILSDVINLKIDDKHLELNNLEYGVESEKSFTVENLSDQKENFNILFSDITNDFQNELVYSLYEGEKLVVSETIAPKTGENGYIKINILLNSAEKKEYKLKMVLQNKNGLPIEDYKEKKFSANIEVNSLTINSTIKTATNYLLAKNNVLTDDMTEGFFKTLETNNNLPSYYYKGLVNNNYVSFNNEFYRIVRINEDGSIRIIKDTNISTSVVFNADKTLENANNYLESNVKTELDNYYNDNLKQYESMLVAQDYCTKDVIVKNDNYKTSEDDKNYQEYVPTYKCNEPSKQMIGLLSYSEANMSGLQFNNGYNSSYSYLNNGDSKNTWLLNKAGDNTRFNDKYVWYIDNGLKDTSVTNGNISIRPVINLKGSLNVVGQGTVDNPYIFSE